MSEYRIVKVREGVYYVQQLKPRYHYLGIGEWKDEWINLDVKFTEDSAMGHLEMIERHSKAMGDSAEVIATKTIPS
jgi:hypothetical protein